VAPSPPGRLPACGGGGGGLGSRLRTDATPPERLEHLFLRGAAGPVAVAPPFFCAAMAPEEAAEARFPGAGAPGTSVPHNGSRWCSKDTHKQDELQSNRGANGKAENIEFEGNHSCHSADPLPWRSRRKKTPHLAILAQIHRQGAVLRAAAAALLLIFGYLCVVHAGGPDGSPWALPMGLPMAIAGTKLTTRTKSEEERHAETVSEKEQSPELGTTKEIHTEYPQRWLPRSARRAGAARIPAARRSALQRAKARWRRWWRAAKAPPLATYQNWIESHRRAIWRKKKANRQAKARRKRTYARKKRSARREKDAESKKAPQEGETSHHTTPQGQVNGRGREDSQRNQHTDWEGSSTDDGSPALIQSDIDEDYNSTEGSGSTAPPRYPTQDDTEEKQNPPTQNRKRRGSTEEEWSSKTRLNRKMKTKTESIQPKARRKKHKNNAEEGVERHHQQRHKKHKKGDNRRPQEQEKEDSYSQP